MSVHQIQFKLNGKPHACGVPAQRLLIDLLRDEYRLFGTKEGCSVGVCGSCSVLVDGRLLSACLLPAVFIDGTDVVTVEGLAAGSQLSSLQDAFIRCGGFQCGICTPGHLVAASALLAENTQPSREEIRDWMMGNLCRCTGYYQIVEAIESAAQTP